MTTTTGKIRILVAEDHALVRTGLVMILKTCPDFEVVAEAQDGEEAIALFRQHQPDLALLDLRMPKIDGPGVIERLRGENKKARFIVLTTFDSTGDVHRALEAGAHGYLLKGAKQEELVEAIRDVVQRRLRRVPVELLDRVIARVTGPELTTRESEILKLLARGKSNAEIGQTLNIVESTVKNHVTNVLAKLGVTSRTQAAIAAFQMGLVTSED
jgi:two-component system, NarL family, response regulator